eukprot:scaffold129327_cov65-Phaeocystis_antarctica.AAC.2
MVGGELLEPCVRSLNWSGRAVVVGFASGSIPKVFTYLLTHFLLVCSRTHYSTTYLLACLIAHLLTDLLTEVAANLLLVKNAPGSSPSPFPVPVPVPSPTLTPSTTPALAQALPSLGTPSTSPSPTPRQGPTWSTSRRRCVPPPSSWFGAAAWIKWPGPQPTGHAAVQ